MSGTSFFRRHWLLVLSLGASLFVLAFGLILIQLSSPGEAVPSPELDAELTLLQPPLPELNQAALDEEQLRAALQQLSKGFIPADFAISPETLDAYLQQQEPGSENWCDLMLLKADDAWTDDDALLFAQKCI